MLQILNKTYLLLTRREKWQMAFFFVLVENYSPQLFPIYAGHPFITLAPFLGLAPIFGVPIYSFAIYWLALSLGEYFKKSRIDWQAVSFFLLVIIISLVLPIMASVPHSSRSFFDRL